MRLPLPDTADPDTFALWQLLRRKVLCALLGEFPVTREPRAELVRSERHPGFTLEHLILDLNGIEPVPAYLLLPDARPPRAPGLLYLHAHGGTYELGKEELLRGRDVMRPYAGELAARGIVTLAIDSWCFSGRKHRPDGRRGEWDTFKLMLWQGRVLWGMMLFDEWRALDYLLDRPEVDRDRVGAFGLSMGATKAWWLAALDVRVRLCVDLCCLTDFDELIRTDHLDGHGIYYYVPRLLKYFSTADVSALIVPRPRISLNGRDDPLTPPAGVERVRDSLAPLYERFGRLGDCRIELFDCGHEETPAMRRAVLEAFDRYLVCGSGM